MRIAINGLALTRKMTGIGRTTLKQILPYLTVQGPTTLKKTGKSKP